MKRIFTFAALAAAASTAAHAGDLRTTQIFSHPSQGDVAAIAGAASNMVATQEGVFVNFETNGLTPGNAYTLWFIAIGEPAACATSPCTGKDVLTQTAAVSADVGFADGAIAGPDGSAEFARFQPFGQIKDGWFGTGIENADATEVHLMVKDHGPVIAGREGEMLSSFRDGCAEDSIPAIFPDVARSNGAVGPNACADVQFAIFTVETPES